MQSSIIVCVFRNSASLVPLDFRIFKILALSTSHEAPQTLPPFALTELYLPQRPFSNTVDVRSWNTSRNKVSNPRHATKGVTRA